MLRYIMVARLSPESVSNPICYNSSATYRLGLATPDVPQQHSVPIGGFSMSIPPFPAPRWATAGEGGKWRPPTPEERAERRKEALRYTLAYLGDKFWSKVTELKNGCWVYGPLPAPNWYRTTDLVDGSGIQAHRLAYMLINGEVEDWIHVHHACLHKYCVKPAHLEALSKSAHRRERHRGESRANRSDRRAGNADKLYG
jgi:hypothetical protein